MTDPMPTDFRALCAELVDCLEKANWPLRHKTLFEICLAEARTALAQPEPVAPTTPSEWHLLSLEQPSLNALCEYTCHANNWEVIQGKGKWHEQTNPTVSGFTNSHGLFVSDPTQTLWRLAQPEPQGLVPEVDDILRLAAIIREVDGNNDKGATALAEAILSHSDSRWQHAKPEPQGPTQAELRTFACKWWHSFGFVKNKATCTWVIDQIAPEHFVDFSRDLLARWGRPSIEPVPVSERLPGPEAGR